MERAGHDLLIRAPNHLGDLVMAMPALESAAGADLLIPRWLASIVELAPRLAAAGGRVIPMERGRRAFVRIVREIRRARYRRGVLLTPSFSSALIFAAGGVVSRRGTPTDNRRLLLTDIVSRERLDGLHRSSVYQVLVTGGAGAPVRSPWLVVPESARTRWGEVAGEIGAGGAGAGHAGGRGALVGIFPGGNASSRRWEPARFAELVRRLAGQGIAVVVFGGPQERAVGAAVAGGVALDLAGRTDLPLLAAGLAACDLVVSNDSGPMHLAAAVGTPTISLWGAGNPAVTGPGGKGHVLLRHAELPCVPCERNVCARRGRGYILAEAENECLRLIEVEELEEAVRQRLEALR